MSIVIEKLVREIKRVQKESSNVRFNFDDDLKYLFFSDDNKSDLESRLLSHAERAQSSLLFDEKTTEVKALMRMVDSAMLGSISMADVRRYANK